MSKSVIYTAIFGDYDKLDDPQVISDNCDYVCFTDDCKFKSDVWDVRMIDLPISNDCPRSNRYVKINPHKFFADYEYSLYLDGDLILKGILDIVKILDGYNIAIEKHPCKEICLYREAVRCKKLGFGIASEIDQQIEDYKKAGFPEYAGLWSNGIIFRKHNELNLIAREEEWWGHVMKYSWRDQISFPVVFKDYPVKTLPPYYLFHSQIIGFKDHLRKV